MVILVRQNNVFYCQPFLKMRKSLLDMRIALDFQCGGGFVGSIIIDLSKAYDCLKNDLLLVKLQAYGFSKNV